jgi:hypothetical protein
MAAHAVAQLVTLKCREIVSIGRATALWALLCLSETPPADAIRVTWLLQAIAATQTADSVDVSIRFISRCRIFRRFVVRFRLLLFISFCYIGVIRLGN